MAINKVEFGDQTLIDLTGDTVTPEDVLEGKTFHTKSGDASVGTAGPYAGSDTNGGPATTAKKLFGQDTRSVNSPPSFYLASGQNSTLVTEFKNRAVIDAPGSSNFGTLITVTPWMDSSGGLPVQTYVDNTGQKAIRFAQTSETWGSWSTLASNSDIPSVGNGTIKLQRNGVDIMTFTTNQNSNVTGNLIIPTKVSELTNDSEFISDDDPRLTDSRNAKDVYAWAKASTKPSYTASEVGAIATSAKGANGGVAELDSAGKVPSSQLPSFVDDVLEYDSLSNFPTTGETGKIYIAKDTNKTYRWSGTTYVEISASLALGETSSTAYRGDRGKTAYDHSQVTSGNPHNVTKSDVGLGNVPNVTTDNQTPTVTEASTRANIATGDTLKTIIGKIKKFFTDLKTVAFTGSYNDLTNKPTIPAAQVNSDWNATSGVAQILNKPTIPTVNNATLTIQKNGTNVQTFTANQSTNATANITVPTKVSELTNDSGYTTNVGTITGIKMNGSSKGTSGVVDLGTVITSHQDISGKVNKSGDTMTGQLKTSFKSAVAMGSYCATATTIPNLCEELRYSSGCCGSVSIGTAYTKDSITVATGWYNFLWIPHRSGGSNGAASGDNCNYGSLYLSGMTVANSCYLIRYNSEAIAEIHNLYKDTTYGVVSTSSNGLAPKVTDTSKFLKGDGTWATPTDTNTHRPIQVNGTEILGNNTTALNLKAGSNVSVTNSSGTVTIAATDTNTWRGIQDNLTSSTNTTESLSAKQGYLLANGSARDSTKLPLAGGTMTGSLNLANNTWNNVGDDAMIGDINRGGSVGIIGKNSNTSIFFVSYGQTEKNVGGYITWDGSKFSFNGYTLEKSVPSNAVFTDNDTKNTAGSTDTSSKIFLIGATSQAANPQTYSDDQVYVTSGTLQANVVSASAGVNANTANSGSSGGVSLYNNNPAVYGIVMRNTGTSTGQLGKHGYVQGDWAGYLCFDGATNRGYIFRHSGNNIASISGEGHAVFNGSVTIGGNTANTSGARMQYNSTNQCIDFIFV